MNSGSPPRQRWLGKFDADSDTLPSDLRDEIRLRLSWACFIYAGTFTAAYELPRWVFEASPPPSTGFADLTAAVAILVSIAMGAFVRVGKLSWDWVVRLALAYLVVGGSAIVITEYWTFFEPENVAAHGPNAHIHGISWVCMWIAAFVVLVPVGFKKLALATLLTATTPALALIASYRHFDPASVDSELMTRLITGAAISTLVAAGMALAVASTVHGLTRKVSEARRLGSYHLVELLGRGGMGEVWRAEHKLLARPAAVKLVRADAISGGGGSPGRALRRFEREAQATAQLRCPHSIGLYDFGVASDGTFYYVMELLEGLTLEDLVERHGPQPPERVVPILRQALLSLAEAHERGLLHRDIKPANIFCCRYGRDLDFVKVLDFGLVKTFRSRANETRLTADGAAAGTPAYMSPEAVLGEQELDARADLYALGCVAYWLLTGHLVFEATSPVRMALLHVERAAEPPSQMSELVVPAELDALILDCLAKRPEDRPADATAVIERLDAIPVSRSWTRERALSWWQSHQPASSQTGSFVSSSVDQTDPTLRA